MPTWFMGEVKGQIFRQNMQVPGEGCQCDLQVGKNQRDALHILVQGWAEQNLFLSRRMMRTQAN